MGLPVAEQSGIVYRREPAIEPGHLYQVSAQRQDTAGAARLLTPCSLGTPLVGLVEN